MGFLCIILMSKRKVVCISEEDQDTFFISCIAGLFGLDLGPFDVSLYQSEVKSRCLGWSH